MPDKTKHTLEEVLDAFDKGHTMVGAAHRLGCSFGTIYNYRKRWKAVDDAIKMHRRELVDIGETGLRGALLKAEPWAIAFALKTLGKDEGYAERTENTGRDGGPIQIDDVGISDEQRASRIAAILERARARRDRQTDSTVPEMGTSGGTAD